MLQMYNSHDNTMQAIINKMTGLATDAQNFQTDGYKPMIFKFQSLFNAANSVLGGHFGNKGIAGRTSPAGVGLIPVGYDMSQGAIQGGKPMNSAIQGSGFFVLETINMKHLLTRASSFIWHLDGSLRDHFNRKVKGYKMVNGKADKSQLVTIKVNPNEYDVTDLGFELEGILTSNYQARQGILSNNSDSSALPEGKQLFQLALARVPNSPQMDKFPGEVFKTNLRSGTISKYGVSSDNSFGQVIGGSSESSNVNPAEIQINALQDQRYYNLNQAMIGMTNQALTKLMDILK